MVETARDAGRRDGELEEEAESWRRICDNKRASVKYLAFG